jgi:hypothetical protein
MADLPGGTSGLLCRDYKGNGADRLVTRIDPGVVSLVAELRAATGAISLERRSAPVSDKPVFRRNPRQRPTSGWATNGSNSRTYGEISPIVRSHVSTSSGHLVIGYCVRRSPKACLPSAYKCISTGTPAFFRAM